MKTRCGGRIAPLQRNGWVFVLAMALSGAVGADVLKADFNGDGREDLVVSAPGNKSVGDFNPDGLGGLLVGVPGEDLDTGSNQKDAGIVHVFYGTVDGLSTDPALGTEVLSQGFGTVGPAASREGDRFGAVLP